MSDAPRSFQSWVSTIQTGRTHSWRFSTSSENIYFSSRKTSTGIDLLFEQREFQIATSKKKKVLCSCIMYQIRMYLVSTGRNLYVRMLCSTNVCTEVPGISRKKYIRTYVMFRPWTRTFHDSNIYQLSLVVATVSFYYCRRSCTLWQRRPPASTA